MNKPKNESEKISKSHLKSRDALREMHKLLSNSPYFTTSKLSNGSTLYSMKPLKADGTR